jgi:hypothetical protein
MWWSSVSRFYHKLPRFVSELPKKYITNESSSWKETSMIEKHQDRELILSTVSPDVRAHQHA